MCLNRNILQNIQKVYRNRRYFSSNVEKKRLKNTRTLRNLEKFGQILRKNYKFTKKKDTRIANLRENDIQR